MVADDDAGRNYWILSCTPATWEIDLAIRDGIKSDFWLVSTNHEKLVRAGDLAVVRVGQDTRTVADLAGRSALKPGVYAICLIEGDPVPGTGSNEKYWRPEDDGGPSRRSRKHVPIKYLRTFLDRPLLLQSLDQTPPILDDPDLIIRARGLWQSTGQISAKDFETILARLGTSTALLTNAPLDPATHVDDRMLDAALEDHVYEAIVRRIEDGGVGEAVKKANGYKCQVCSALGSSGHTFLTTDGTPYVETHHAVPRHLMVRGSLHRTNVIAVCAGHHRQLHHGKAAFVKRLPSGMMHFTIDGRDLFLQSN